MDVDTLNALKKLQCELTVTSGLHLKGSKLIIPKTLQDRVVKLAHHGHQGIVKTKRRIRENVWSPGIDALVEKKAKSRLACQASTYPPKSFMEPQNMSKLQDGLWQKIVIDFCGPFPSGNYLLVAIDE